MLAEDNGTNREVLIGLLRTFAIGIDCANDGRAAVTAARAAAYDLILMDMHMPEMDGCGAAVAIRKDSLNRRTPIVAVTANAFREDLEAAYSSGMNGFLRKPFKPSELFQIVANGLTGRLESMSQPLEAHRGASEVDWAALDELIEDLGAAKVESLVTAYLGETRKILSRFTLSGQRLPRDAVRDAHSSKGSSRLLGANAVGDFAAAIEAGIVAGDESAATAAMAALARAVEEFESAYTNRNAA